MHRCLDVRDVACETVKDAVDSKQVFECYCQHLAGKKWPPRKLVFRKYYLIFIICGVLSTKCHYSILQDTGLGKILAWTQNYRLQKQSLISGILTNGKAFLEQMKTTRPRDKNGRKYFKFFILYSADNQNTEIIQTTP